MPIGVTLSLLFVTASIVCGAPPNPVLSGVFPPGGRAGSTFAVTLWGANLIDLKSLRCSHPKIVAEPAGPNQFKLTIPEDAQPGQYDLQAITAHGLSSIRTFVVGNRAELVEAEPNNAASVPPEGGTTKEGPQRVPLNVVINGRIEKGDLDHFVFTAKQGQRVVIDCQAERIDSRLRAVLELFDTTGRRLAVNRGYFGNDPLIDFIVPADGDYVVKLFDLVYSGSPDHFYRLAIDTGPRVAFAQPNVIERVKTTRVTLHGWNLEDGHSCPSEPNAVERGTGKSAHPPAFDCVTIDITPPVSKQPEHLRLRSQQVTVEGFAYQYPGADAPILIGMSDAPVVSDQLGNQSPKTAQEVAVPCDVSGQLLAGDEQDWFAINARRGEVVWIEGFGERIGSPLDLEISLFDATGDKELANFRDEVRSRESPRFSTSHVDPIGRWVAPADGRYLILVRSVIGGLDADPRRQYRLSLRREEPDYQLVAVPRSDDPIGLNVLRGGRCVVDVLAVRHRGLTGAIRVSAGKNLPTGIECPDIWLGPGVDSAPLVITAGSNVESLVGTLQLEGHSEQAGDRKARGATVTHKGVTGIASRIANDINFAVAGDAPLKITANGHEPKKHHLYGEMQVRHSPGCVLDVAVEVERREFDHQASVRLIGVGMPDLIGNQTAIIPADQKRGTLSFFLPPTLPIGTYTLAVQAETTVPIGPKDASGKQKTEPITVIGNAVTFDVHPASFLVEVDPFSPRTVRRGEIVTVKYTARRVNGFIGKIHTELDAPGEVLGLRGRGVTFTGQTETGTIQIIANDDAPLGQQPFLRLYGVGVLEDKPVFHGSCFLNLEIVK